MNLRSYCVIAACLVLPACASTRTTTPYDTARQEGWSHYGSTPESVGPYVALGALQGDEKNIVVEGVITETCTTSGCWAKIVDTKGNDIIVLTEESRFHLPRNCAGHKAVAHGNMEVRVVPVERRRHHAEVSGSSPEEIAKITEPRRSLFLIADSVYLEGDDLIDAYTVEEAEAACKAQLEKEISK